MVHKKAKLFERPHSVCWINILTHRRYSDVFLFGTTINAFLFYTNKAESHKDKHKKNLANFPFRFNGDVTQISASLNANILYMFQ